MKELSYLVLIFLCLSVECIRSSPAGSHYFVKSKTGSLEQPGFQRIQKRQDSDEKLCEHVIMDTACTNNQFQEVVNFQQKCNFSDQAISYSKTQCAQNSMGKYCNEYDIEYNIESTCYGNEIYGNEIDCSVECIDLLIRIRHELGCCVKITYSYLNPSALWSRCGVELDATECASRLAPNPIRAQHTCTQEELYDGLIAIVCNRRYTEDAQDRLSATDGCQDYKHPALDACKVNKHGNYCSTMLEEQMSSYSAASDHCNDEFSCEPSCIRVLRNITSTFGCCFNERYNDTDDGSDQDWWLSNQYWSMCKLKSPGFCEVKLIDPGLTPGAITGISIAAVVILVTIVAGVAVAVICAVKATSKRKLTQYVCVTGEDEELIGAADTASVPISHTEEGESDQDADESSDHLPGDKN